LKVYLNVTLNIAHHYSTFEDILYFFCKCFEAYHFHALHGLGKDIESLEMGFGFKKISPFTSCFE